MAEQEMLLDSATIKAAVAGEKWATEKVHPCSGCGETICFPERSGCHVLSNGIPVRF